MTRNNDASGCYTLDDRLAQWWDTTTWEEVLDGWTEAGRDNCGCPYFTRPHGPGESVTPKSLTTHEAGCSRGRTDDRHPAGHVWSDHVDDDLFDMTARHGRTLSAFSVYTALHHHGDFAEACRAAGIPTGDFDEDEFAETFGTNFDFEGEDDPDELAAQYADYLDDEREKKAREAEAREAEARAQAELDELYDPATAPGGFSDDELADMRRQAAERAEQLTAEREKATEAVEKATEAKDEARDELVKARNRAEHDRDRRENRRQRYLEDLQDREWAQDEQRRLKAEAAADRVRETYGADAFGSVDLSEDEPDDDVDELPVIARSDGASWGMPATVNSMHGPSGIGKSWLGMFTAALALKSGKRVLMLDYESSKKKVKRRLKRTLGLTKAELRNFGYWRVRIDLTTQTEALNDELDRKPWDVVVLDGVSRSYALGEYDTNDADDTNKWFERLPHYAVARTTTQHGTGACVWLVDHVTKAKEDTPKAYPAGSQAKRANIDGIVASIVATSSPLKKGTKGSLQVWLSKDRDGESLEHTTVVDGEVSLFAIFEMDTTDPDAPAKVELKAPEVAPTDTPGDHDPKGMTPMDMYYAGLDTKHRPSLSEVALSVVLASIGDEGMTEKKVEDEVRLQAPATIDTRQRTSKVTQALKWLKKHPTTRGRYVRDPDNKQTNSPQVVQMVNFLRNELGVAGE